MKIEFDPNKNEKNIDEREISFELAVDFEIDTALIKVDSRHEYQEIRFNALGLIGNRVFHLTYTLRGDIFRVISLRKANKREVKEYALNQ